MTDLKTMLVERNNRYGTFRDQAEIAVHVKESLRAFVTLRQAALAPDQAEAIDMIVHKISRIVNGDPNYADSWRDIAGYATLVADRLDQAARAM